MSEYIPLSLRRKIVIALDPEHVLAGATDIAEDLADEALAAQQQKRFATFKTVAWAKANVLRPQEDHVFLATSLDTAPKAFDPTVLASIWNSLAGGSESHASRRKKAQEALRRLSEQLSQVGVSASWEALEGPMGEQIPRCVERHRGELLVVQAPERGGWADMVSFSWADVCVRQAGCPVLVVQQKDLPDNVALAMDPPAAGQDMASAWGDSRED
ncbi:hypothetical protein LPJ79_002703 [Coemansia sp. RSA 1821]|nr:hypothetical protein BX667DRAFT_494995 [Coemansia mojavensis]KAJ1739423.1 hypothetical protein LPJ68_004694 [Coemansia sp. RSA 1086]KAJ1750670.1 hypothetical protein LPJ79_002703 [Coemansia sp. RSA 1821]